MDGVRGVGGEFLGGVAAGGHGVGRGELEQRPTVRLDMPDGDCYVTSLHDGMNLVCKEFVAARDDLQGVLILSRFAGAARELCDLLLVASGAYAPELEAAAR